MHSDRKSLANEKSDANDLPVLDQSSHNQKHLVVCSLAAVSEMVAATKASALISVLHPELIPDTPKTIAPDQHFKLAIDDIEAPHEGLQHAELKHIDALCQFADTWHAKTTNHETSSDLTCDTSQGSLIVHCYAGISRSTAAAFVVLCALNPKVDELTIAKYMRNCSATAAPNRLIVSLGDEVLGRKGRMTKAIRSIDRSLSYEPTHPFALQTKLEHTRKSLFTGSKAA